MTRYVVNNSEVPHLWAHQAQSHARGNGSTRFDGTTLYSYHTPIAEIVEDVYGGRVALLSDASHSITTTRHQSNAWRAVHNVLPFFTVHNIPANSRWPHYRNLSDTHITNVAKFVASYKYTMACLRRKREFPAWQQEHMHNLITTACDYCCHFGVINAELDAIDPVADWQAIVAFFAERTARLNTPQAIAARERATERKREKIREDYRSATGDCDPDSIIWHRRRGSFDMTPEDDAAREATLSVRYAEKLEQWANGAEVYLSYGFERCATADQRDRRAAFEAIRDAEKIANWRNHVSGSYPPRGAAALLRLSSDGREIETSWGAAFPAEHGAKVFPLIAACRRKAQPIALPADHRPHLGAYRLDRIDADGTVHAGCHVVLWGEVAAMALALNIDC